MIFDPAIMGVWRVSDTVATPARTTMETTA